jgi:hypothetical protein
VPSLFVTARRSTSSLERMTQRGIVIFSIACAIVVPISLFVVSVSLGQHPHGPPLPFHQVVFLACILFLIFNIPVLLLGLPAILLLRKFAYLRLWSLCATAFLSGVTFTALNIFVFAFDSTKAAALFWDSGTVASEYGVPTHEGWLVLVQRSSLDGAFCVFTVLCWWVAWTVLTRSNNRLEQRVSTSVRSGGVE